MSDSEEVTRAAQSETVLTQPLEPQVLVRTFERDAEEEGEQRAAREETERGRSRWSMGVGYMERGEEESEESLSRAHVTTRRRPREISLLDEAVEALSKRMRRIEGELRGIGRKQEGWQAAASPIARASPPPSPSPVRAHVTTRRKPRGTDPVDEAGEISLTILAIHHLGQAVEALGEWMSAMDGGLRGTGRQQGDWHATSSPMARGSPPPPPARAGSPQRSRVQEKPLLAQRFNGDPKKLGYFLAHVYQYMQDYGKDFPDEAAQVRAVTRALEGSAADWFVAMFNSRDPALKKFDDFMVALRARFEDPTAERKAVNRLKAIKQRNRTVAEYTQEFRELMQFASVYNSETLMEFYRDGLNDDVYYYCMGRGPPRDLYNWFKIAAEVEVDLARNRREKSSMPWKSTLPEEEQNPKPMGRGAEGKRRKPAYSYPGKEGPRGPDRLTKPSQRETPAGSKKSEQRPEKTLETARLVKEMVEIAIPTGENPGCSAVLTIRDDEEAQGVSAPASGSLYIPIILQGGESGVTVSTMALIDSGSPRNLISPGVAKRMNLKLQPLASHIVFRQMDGSTVGGEAARFDTGPLQMTIGPHQETLNFVVVPEMENPLILGMAWLRKWNPNIDWRTGEVCMNPKIKALENPNRVPPQRLVRVATVKEVIVRKEKVPKDYGDLKEADKLPPQYNSPRKEIVRAVFPKQQAAAKIPPGRPKGLPQKVENPSAPRRKTSMDSIVKLPESGGTTVIRVVTDLFPKQVHFVPGTKMPTASKPFRDKYPDKP